MPEVYSAKKKNRTTQKSSKPKTKSKIPHRSKDVDEYSEILRKEKPEKNPLKAYAPKPLQVFFDSQLQEEQVVLLLRRHPITQWKKILIAIGLALLPFLFINTPTFEVMPDQFIFAAFLGWFLFIIGFIFESFLLWFFNVYIVTDERIIDVDFVSVIYKNVSSAKIENIEDITATSSGVLSSIVDYGTILIQTAGEKNEFEFEDVPHPAKVTAILNELMMEEEQEKIEGRVR